MAKQQFFDDLGRSVQINLPPQRIISLCPSQTETLVRLGLQDRIVGKTRFCIHPKEVLAAIPNVGGTKEVHLDRIHALKPDLIIGEKEENTQAMIAALELEWPVFVTDVRDIPSAKKMILSLGTITQTVKKAEEIVINVDQSLTKIIPLKFPVRCLYLIWKSPWMAAGADTFIDSMLKKCGFDNVACAIDGRYPVLAETVFLQKNPQIIFLSSEPFPFREMHIAEIQNIMPNSAIIIVDGEIFSWYGSRMIGVENYLNGLLHNALSALSLHN